MPDPTFTLSIDTDGDFGVDGSGQFSHVVDSDDIRRLRWHGGFREERDPISEPFWLEVTLDNSPGNAAGTFNYYNPASDSALSGLQKGRAIKLQSHHADEMGPEPGYEGVGDDLPCPLFDGTADTVDIFNSGYQGWLAASGALTLMIFWTPPDADVWTDSTRRDLLHFYINASNYGILYKSATDNTIRGEVTAGGTSKYVEFTDLGGETELIFLAVTHDEGADELKVFAQGVAVGSTQTGLGALSGNITAARIARNAASAANYSSGLHAHAVLADAAATPAELLAFWKQRYNITSLLASTFSGDNYVHYKLDEPSAPGGQYAYDYGGNGYHGTYNTRTRTRTECVLTIDDITPTPDASRRDEVVLRASDDIERLRKLEIRDVPLQVDATAYDCFKAIFTHTGVQAYRPDVMGPYTRIGAWTINTHAIGKFPDLWGEFDTGIRTFPFALDDQGPKDRAYDLLRKVAASELGGRLWWGRDGQWHFSDSHYDYKHTTNLETFSNIFSEFKTSYGKKLITRVDVSHKPRHQQISESEYIIASFNSDFPVPGQAGRDGVPTADITLPYTDEYGEPVTTTRGIQPRWGTDFYTWVVLSSESQGFGGNGQRLGCQAFFGAAEVKLKFTNPANYTVYVTQESVVRAENRIITWKKELHGFARDADVELANGVFGLDIDAPYLESNITAKAYAEDVLRNYKDPKSDVERVKFRPRGSEALITAALARDINDRINVQDDESGTDQDFFIAGFEHDIIAPFNWTTTWLIRPAPTNKDYWRINHPNYGRINTGRIAA